jgi:hypothetical protein
MKLNGNGIAIALALLIGLAMAFSCASYGGSDSSSSDSDDDDDTSVDDDDDSTTDDDDDVTTDDDDDTAIDDDDDTIDDDDDDDDSFTPQPYCTEEQTCWSDLEADMQGASSEGAFDAGTAAFFSCLNSASGCTGVWVDCHNGCGGDANCKTQCQETHLNCLSDNCGYDRFCYNLHYSNFNLCLPGCSNWNCRKGCWETYATKTQECW